MIRLRATCKDCGKGTEAPEPGPRCSRCHKVKKKADGTRRWAASLMKKYGLTEEQYWAMYAEQGGKCALCQRATGRTKRLAVDHDHKTGLARGLACGPCNREVIGILAGDDPEYFRRGYIHLTNGAAKRLGIIAKAAE